MSHPLLDPPPLTATRVAAIEDRVRALLGTRLDLVLVPAEAVLPIEAAARGLGHPGVRALNLVSGPYGAMFGAWLREGGAEVTDLVVGYDTAVSATAVREAFARDSGYGLVSLVHAEAATGAINPAAEIAAVAREHDALVVLDAVASIGADSVELDAWEIDIAVMGPQKALAGPAGVSIVTVSEQAWAALEANPRAPRGSSLSLLDWKERWLDPGRRALPGTPVPLEFFALEAAVDRVAIEGLDAWVGRHCRARDAARAGLRALGLTPWVTADHEAAAVATTVRIPAGHDPRTLVAAAPAAALSPGFAELAARLVRIDHTGRAATPEVVAGALRALGAAVGARDVESAVEVALAAAR
jgi:aspartate aminotransferase-like enzyme